MKPKCYVTYKEFLERDNVIIEPADLENMGLATMQVWYRP